MVLLHRRLLFHHSRSQDESLTASGHRWVESGKLHELLAPPSSLMRCIVMTLPVQRCLLCYHQHHRLSSELTVSKARLRLSSQVTLHLLPLRSSTRSCSCIHRRMRNAHRHEPRWIKGIEYEYVVCVCYVVDIVFICCILCWCEGALAYVYIYIYICFVLFDP